MANLFRVSFTLPILLLLFVNFVRSGVVPEETDATSTAPPFSELIKHVESISSKIQSIKDRVEKTINETRLELEQSSQDMLARKGFKLGPGHGYYKVYQVELSWHEAFKFCRRQRAHLAVIDSDDERSILGTQITNTFQSPTEADSVTAYIGIKESCKRGSWMNIFFDNLDGKEYLVWKEDDSEHGKSSDVSYCATIDANGKLNKVDCAKEHYFICETSY